MTTNFDYLKQEPKFSAFADTAISAEKIVLLDPSACIINCRRAMEFAVKWMYSVDNELQMPYQDNLQSLINAEEYRQIVGQDIWKRMDYIRCCGNNVAHTTKKMGRDEAMLCLENLFIFLDYVAYCYSDSYEEQSFKKELITCRIEKARQSQKEVAEIKEKFEKNQRELEQKEINLQKLIKENESLKEELSARRQEKKTSYIPKPLDLSEYDTRKLYIDAMLIDAGWKEGKDWLNEVPIPGIPSRSGSGRADYVLYDDRNRPLAIIEAKSTGRGVEEGRYQAKLYADALEREYHRRPVIFLTNGFETHIIDGQYSERKCSGIYSKRDLEKWFNLQSMKTGLDHISVNKEIAGRYYQEEAIIRVCESFGKKNRRKALLVMATGSGKTRTVIALCDVLLKAGWVKNILFLADRTALITQAKRSFVNLLPNLSCTNLVEEKDNYSAHCVFSTYQTMMKCIDTVSDNEGKLFTCGHFDLLICDEAHRSIYNKYRDIFDYFDAPLVGLTATPKDEIDKNAQGAIDEFSDAKKLPQIAISVDMLDTGIDVPEILNLVFFKKVLSKAKFRQMIGRGTRLCPGLLDGEDKSKFYIFDFCGNFEFFRINKGKPSANMIALQGAIFNLQFEMVYKLQAAEFQKERLIAYRKRLVGQMVEKVCELPRDNFAVKQHLKYVELYSIEDNYQTLTFEDTLTIKEEVAPLILPEKEEVSAIRFDALMYGIELAYLLGEKYTRARGDLIKKVSGIASVANIPEIQTKTDLINKILHTDYVERAGIDEFEKIREELRSLMKYIPKTAIRYDTNFEDDILTIEWNESELEDDQLKNYKAKAEYYIRQHQDNIVIAKLKTNKPLNTTDIDTLEEILWKEIGTKKDYEAEYGEKPLGEFVREIVGLDMNAAKEAFSEYLDNANLDSRQIYFVNQIVEYIVHNGMMKDLSVLQESPFTDQGSIVDIFTDMSVWMGIKGVIDKINANAVA